MAEKQKKSKIEQLPEETRKKILWISLMILALIILFCWLYSLKFSLAVTDKEKQKQEAQQKQWENIQNDLGNLLNQARQGVGTIKEQIDATKESATATPATSGLNNEQIEKLKEKLESDEQTQQSDSQPL